MGYRSFKIRYNDSVILVAKRPSGYNELGGQTYDLVKSKLPYFYYVRASKTSESSAGDSNRRLEDIVTLYTPVNNNVVERDIIFVEDAEYQVFGHPQIFDNGRNVSFMIVNLAKTTG